jgi:DNA-binding LacI/PurR family transcriptional regulator
VTRQPAEVAKTRRLAEVAKKVGVSEATVSRVLNGKPGVSDATRAAVLTALDVLGYERPTQLRGERARLVGLVLPELGNPIFPALAEVIGGALAQRGFTPVLCVGTAGGLSEADYVEMLVDQQVSGVVFAGGSGRPGQRGVRGPRVPEGIHRRRGRGGTGLRAPGLPRS